MKASFRSFATLTSGILTGFLLLTLIGAWWLGAFNTVDVALRARGPYIIVYLPTSGPYKNQAGKILKVADLMADHADALGTPCAIKYDDPSEVPEAELRGKCGYVLKREVEVELPLQIERIPQQEVLVGRLEGHAMLATVKVYPKMSAWMQEHRAEADGPALELYEDGAVECQIPVRPAAENADSPATENLESPAADEAN